MTRIIIETEIRSLYCVTVGLLRPLVVYRYTVSKVGECPSCALQFIQWVNYRFDENSYL